MGSGETEDDTEGGGVDAEGGATFAGDGGVDAEGGDAPLIRTDHLTKDYGSGRGVFDISLAVNRGECFGFLGPNGAGKTTVIRHLMGFSRPQEGTTSICGLDSWKNAAKLQRDIGYLPGEIALPDNMTGTAFLRMMEKMRGMRNDDHLDMLLDTFELDPDISTRQMSLGVKRKLAVVVAFMHDPAILVLDEPTSGLDPVMQQVFIDFVLREKTRGKTIFLSSHLFNEVDATCDRIAIIRDGHLVSLFDTDEFRNRGERFYRIALGNDEDYESFAAKPYDFAEFHPRTRRVKVHVNDSDISHLIDDIADLDVVDFEEAPFTLEDYFMQF